MREVNTTLCRHCGRGKVTRPRCLCWGCYYQPGVRELHPVNPSRGACRGVPDFCGTPRLPEEPTASVPGSPEKVAVLVRRCELRQNLWHPLDAGTPLALLE